MSRSSPWFRAAAAARLAAAVAAPSAGSARPSGAVRREPHPAAAPSREAPVRPRHRAAAPAAPAIDAASQNPGTSVAGNLCVTANLGGGADYNCGDLRLVHPLPAVTTYGVRRQVALVYNSAHAVPTPVVRISVTVPSTAGTPD